MIKEGTIVIRVNTPEEEYEVAEALHEKLKGTKDYIDSNICINMSSDRQDNTKNEVHVVVFPESETTIDFELVRKHPKLSGRQSS